jgi:hypothetical protein
MELTCGRKLTLWSALVALHQGNAVTDLDFIDAISSRFRLPSAFTSSPELEQASWLFRLTSQMGKRALFDDVHIAGGDAAAGVNVAAEIRARHRLEGLRFA